MIRRLTGTLAAFLVLLAGAWLVLAPFALGTQASGQAWTTETRTDVWTGTGVLVIGLAGVAAFVAALRQDLADRGLAVRRPTALPVPDPEQPKSDDLVTLLRPLVAALTADLEREHQQEQEQEEKR
jgi:hypothetical protein